MKSEDRRIHKTRQAIKNALKSLLVTNNLQDISVRQLAQHADITRKTFYNHYGNISDVLDEIENDYLDEFFARIINAEEILYNPSLFPSATVDYLYATQQDFLLIIRSSDIYKMLQKFITREKSSLYDRYRQQLNIPENYADYLLSFIGSGTLVVFYNWLNTPGHGSIEELRTFFTSVFTIDFWSTLAYYRDLLLAPKNPED